MILGRILVSLVLALAAVASGRNIVSDRGGKFGNSIILHIYTMSLQNIQHCRQPHPSCTQERLPPADPDCIQLQQQDHCWRPHPIRIQEGQVQLPQRPDCIQLQQQEHRRRRHPSCIQAGWESWCYQMSHCHHPQLNKFWHYDIFICFNIFCKLNHTFAEIYFFSPAKWSSCLEVKYFCRGVGD